MFIVGPQVNGYLEKLAASPHPILREMEEIALRRAFPCVGPQVGRLLHALALATGARRVLELGSGFGYSAFWFVLAVGPEGQVVLTENSADLAREASAFFERAGLENRIRIEVGEALEIAGREQPPFDLVFNDVDKEEYPKVAEVAARLLRPGGLLVSDNMLWDGEVVDDSQDDETQGIVELTRTLYASGEFFTALVPLRDGVSISVRL